MTLARTAWNRHIALGLVSAALLAAQVVMMQILATSQWSHFAALVISIALLGFGVAGSLLALNREKMLKEQARLLPVLFLICSITLVGPFEFAQYLFGGFDSLMLFSSPIETAKLGLSALILMCPFVSGALGIGLVFTAETQKIGSYYFSNLIGSGFGVVIALWGLDQLYPEYMLPLCALLPLIGAMTLLGRKPSVLWGGMILTVFIIGFCLAHPRQIQLSQYKDLQRTLNLPGAEIIARQPSAAGQIHLVYSPALHSSDAISLRWQEKAINAPTVFINGNAYGAAMISEEASLSLDATPNFLPYALGRRNKVLVLDSGTGTYVQHALNHGATQVTAVEAYPDVLMILQKTLSDRYNQLLKHPNVDWVTSSPRVWLARDNELYDLIILPEVGSFGGDSGLFALAERPLLTTEALTDAFGQLTPHGCLIVTTWLDYPVRRPVRLLNTIVTAMNNAKMSPAKPYIAAIRSWATITFYIKRTPLIAEEVEATRRFAEQWQFDLALLPNIQTHERQRFHKLYDDSILGQLDLIVSDKSKNLFGNYPFRIDPPTDNQPFFDQFLRWQTLPELSKLYGWRTLSYIEIGWLIAALSALILSSLAIMLIIFPLLKLPKSTRTFRTCLYFGGLAFGYMWVEMGLIHQLTVYLNYPTIAAAVVIGTMLIGSGLGSFFSVRILEANSCRIASLIFFAVMGYAMLFSPLLTKTLDQSHLTRALVTISAILPLAFLMGMPFPLGLRWLDKTRPKEVPWAWGINNCLSVAGAAIATLFAVEFGYKFLLIAAAVAYAFPAAIRIR
ncbi:MAG: hypothetical protein JRD88_04530 [Deltaproteobacteria bacterium]|jgi:hypothetical protein|nr:hypothetical protein [Deltaproteobacteria bacterium]